MLHLPLLRWGRPYRSLQTAPLRDLRSGAVLAETSLANPGLIARDLLGAAAARQALAERTTADLLAIAGRAAHLFAEGELPLGDGAQGAGDYLAQVSATTGLPRTLARRNMEKIRSVLGAMPRVLGGLTRGLPLEVLDRGWGEEEGRLVAFRRETDVLGAVLPSNSPGVHGVWLPALPLKVALALRPGRQEPWTPYRVAQAFIAAGCPPQAIGVYPSDHAGAGEILLRCGRSLLFGDRATVEPWEGDPRIQVHGPGWSKVVFGADQAAGWRDHLDLLVTSVAENGGRSCINASGIWTPAHASELARGLAERLAAIAPRPLDDPGAELAALPSLEAARHLSEAIDAQLRQPGAVDVSAAVRGPERVVTLDGCAFLQPTVVHCTDPRHPLAQAEYLFPFVAVVEAPAVEMTRHLGPSLVVTALTADPALVHDLLAAPGIERLNLAPVATCRVDWDQPHEGNLFEHLYRRRALQPPAALGAA